MIKSLINKLNETEGFDPRAVSVTNDNTCETILIVKQKDGNTYKWENGKWSKLLKFPNLQGEII